MRDPKRCAIVNPQRGVRMSVLRQLAALLRLSQSRTPPGPEVQIERVRDPAGGTQLEQRHDMLQHFDARDHTDIMAGYTFCATMQLRTPLRVLLRHGEKHQGPKEPPVIAREQWKGIWIPVSKSWAELGFDLRSLRVVRWLRRWGRYLLTAANFCSS